MKVKQEDIEQFYPESRKAWREWLKENHKSEQSVWLICYKKKSGKPTVTWEDAVEEALCFGWIDSVRRTLDDERFIQFFSKRKPRGTWSKINKEKIELLIKNKQMTKAGLESIALAKKNGSWTLIDSVEELEIPKDLDKAFKARPGSKDYFTGLSKSVMKAILAWLILAKRPETREKRILEIADLAAQGKKPKQFTVSRK